MKGNHMKRKQNVQKIDESLTHINGLIKNISSKEYAGAKECLHNIVNAKLKQRIGNFTKEEQ